MNRTLPFVVLALALLAPVARSAGDSPAAVAKYRQTLMEAAGRHMKASSMIVKGEVSRKEDLVGHATALHEIAKGLPALFPEGSGPGGDYETDAKPEVWSRPEDFAAACKTFEEQTAKLVEVAQSGDTEAFKTQFGNVGQSCGDCHDVFRVEHEHKH